MNYITWDTINNALDHYERADDEKDRADAIESVLFCFDEATPKQQEYIVASAGEWVRG